MADITEVAAIRRFAAAAREVIAAAPAAVADIEGTLAGSFGSVTLTDPSCDDRDSGRLRAAIEARIQELEQLIAARPMPPDVVAVMEETAAASLEPWRFAEHVAHSVCVDAHRIAAPLLEAWLRCRCFDDSIALWTIASVLQQGPLDGDASELSARSEREEQLAIAALDSASMPRGESS